MRLEISCGDASLSNATADLVFCHPYAPLPPHLIGVPAIINLFGDKLRHGEKWVGAKLAEIGRWGRGHRNTLYVAHLPVHAIEVADLIEDETAPRVGFMPLDLPLRVLRAYGRPGITVWNGFMGRGTIGAACRELGMNYIGIDRDPERVAMAEAYLRVRSG